MSYYINPNAILDNSIKQSSLPVKVQEKADLYHINKQKPPIVGRCIPLQPEEGNRYYFTDGILKVKTRSNKLGFYYINIGGDGLIFTIPKKETQDYIDLKIALNALYTGYVQSFTPTPNLVNPDSILVEFPIFNACINSKVIKFNSLTRSPYVTINNGELVVDKPLFYTPLSVDNSFLIYPKPVYYHYSNNHSSTGRLNTVAYDGIPWREHRKTLKGTLYKYKYTYRKIKSKTKLDRIFNDKLKGYYKACSIWRRYKISKNNVLYWKRMDIKHGKFIKIGNKVKDRYKI